MKTYYSAIITVLLIAGTATPQVSPAASTLLSSADPAERESGARELAAQVPLGSDAKAALADLLARENALVRQAFREGSGASGKYGEGYSEYVGWLTDTVAKMAASEPDQPEVWNALLGTAAGPGDTAYGRWLGTHGDKAMPYLLRYVADRSPDSWDRMNRRDALKSLAQIVAYERQPATAHHLSAKDLQMVESVIREGADDPDKDVRLATISAIEIMGDPADLPTLDRVALTDEYVVTNAGKSGAEIRFPIRVYARAAAERMRAKLAGGETTGRTQ